MPQNEILTKETAVEDITEMAWEDLVMEIGDSPDHPVSSTGGDNTFTYDQSVGQCGV